MPSKRQPSKQKRADQNRAQRAALQARRDAAAAAASSGGTGSSGGGSGGGRPSLLGRLRGAPAAAATTKATTATTTATTSSSGTSARATGAAARASARSAQPVGYRAALSGLIAAIAAVVLCLAVIRVAVDANGDPYSKERLTAEWAITAEQAAIDAPDKAAPELAADIEEWAPQRSKDLVVKALWPFSAFVFLPLVGAILGFRAVVRRRPSKVVGRAMYATLFGAVLTQGLVYLFIPCILGVGVAMFQVRKYETALAAAAAAEAGDGDPGDDDVIDVDVVEADAPDDATT